MRIASMSPFVHAEARFTQWIAVRERGWTVARGRIKDRRDAQVLCCGRGVAAMTNQATMQVKLIDYARAPIEKLYAAFRTCYSADTPAETWEKIEAGKISRETIRDFIGERLKT